MAAEVAVPCPDCGHPVRPDQQQLCPSCGYPLLLLRAEPEGEARAVPRAPGERDDATALMTATVGAAVPGTRSYEHVAAGPPAAGELDCPRCGYRNEPVRIRCERCGHELRNARPAPVVLPPPEGAVFGRPRRRTWLVVAAVAAAVAVIAAGSVLLARGRDVLPGRTAETKPSALVAVDPATVTAKASSTVPGNRLRIQNTLDGDPRTVWNSDGAHLRSNVGVQLTYRFAEPVKLARITVVNGSAKSAANFAENQRIAELRVRTDAGETTWQLADTVRAQSVMLEPAAPTSVVTLVVRKVYPGNRWPDLALTDIGFERAP